MPSGGFRVRLAGLEPDATTLSRRTGGPASVWGGAETVHQHGQATFGARQTASKG